jgi:hypothetical protein
VRCLDYGLSFICNSAVFNAVRFWVESRTTVTDEHSGAEMEFYQCASCKSEETFAERGLFKEENYDFLPIFGGGLWLVFRRRAWLAPGYRQIHTFARQWGEPMLKLRQAKSVTVLDTWEKIRDATAAALPLVAQTEIRSESSGLRALIEYPIKTMNISLEYGKFQVDTGPIAFPDLAKRYDPPIDCLSLAFIAFNAAHFADFVIEQPTPVVEDGAERCRVYHYSGPISLPARNLVLAVRAEQ